MLLFEFHRGQVGQRAVTPASVVVRESPEDLQAGLTHRRECLPVHDFSFQALPQALCQGVVVARADAAHAPPDPMGAADVRERRRGVLGGFNQWSQHRL